MTEARLFADCDMEQPQLHEFSGGTAGVFSARAPNKSTPNEDSVALIPFNGDLGVLVVADGLGGQPAGERASALAVKQLEKSLRQAAQAEIELRDAILNGIESANEAVMNLAGGCATTLALVEVQGNTVRPYHVGDSVILVTGQRGRLKLQTISHSPVGYAIEAGLLDSQEAMHHEDRHVVSNILGSPDMRIEIGPPVTLAPYDTLVVASDGLVDNLHDEEIVERIRKGSLKKVASQLAAECRRRMCEAHEDRPSKPDDCSFIVFRRKRKRRAAAKGNKQTASA